MTPFDSWYAANVEPNLPKDFPPQLAKAGKNEAAKVWNGANEIGVIAMQDVKKAIWGYYGDALPEHLRNFILIKMSEVRDARVTP